MDRDIYEAQEIFEHGENIPANNPCVPTIPDPVT